MSTKYQNLNVFLLLTRGSDLGELHNASLQNIKRSVQLLLADHQRWREAQRVAVGRLGEQALLGQHLHQQVRTLAAQDL